MLLALTRLQLYWFGLLDSRGTGPSGMTWTAAYNPLTPPYRRPAVYQPWTKITPVTQTNGQGEDKGWITRAG